MSPAFTISVTIGVTIRVSPRPALACVCLMVLLLAPSAARAQQTSSDPATRTEVPPPRPTEGSDDRWWDPYIRGVGWLRSHGIYPEAGIIVAGSGLSFGASYRRPRIGTSRLGAEVLALWSIRGYEEYRLRAGRVDRMRTTAELQPANAGIGSEFNDFAVLSPGLALYVDVVQRDYPRVNFYGIGPEVDLDAKSDYGLDGTTADVVFQWQRDAHVGVSARVGVLDFDIGRGSNGSVPDLQDAFDVGTIPGATAQPRFVTAGLAVVRDHRDSPNVPTSGTFAGISFRRFLSASGDAPDFSRITIDGRAFATPVNDRDVLALRLLVGSDLTPSGRSVPFYLQRQLGGSSTLRGYPSYLLRDQALVHLSAEYRWRAARMMDIVPFIDVGGVESGLRALRTSSFEVTPGIGFRARNDTRVLFRIDVGYRPGGFRFAFSVAPPF